MARPPQILLLTDDRERRRSWEKILHKSVQCWADDAPRHGLTGPEVIVTDHLPVDQNLAECGELLARGEIGIIAIGTPGPADVALTADHSARELRLACSLLTEIVRLRRRRGEDKRAQRALQELAFRDPLTTLPNRRTWDTQLATRLEDLRARSSGRGTCVGLLDLDCFKNINDLHGHTVGDEVLRAVARRLAAGVRERDVVARVGGDEFAVILSAVESAQAAVVVERIRRLVGHHAEEGVGSRLQVTASAGYATLGPGSSVEPQEAMVAADRFLRQAKAAGRDRTLGGPFVGS
ncbi:MAG: GGDEF domain-containing protein [Pirellulaceae bacterium]